MNIGYLQLISERGVPWIVNRSLYSFKLKLLKKIPAFEGVFEKKVPKVKRIDIFDVDVSALKDFLIKLPDEKKREIIKSADDGCLGKIIGFSSVMLDYGCPINWQLNPLTGHQCDKSQKWFSIPDFDAVRGDIKVVWEASRFTHFYYLARAFLLTDDEKYIKAFSQQLSGWVKENPYSYGANFKCGQECAIRMLSTLLTYSVFKDFLSKEDTDNIKEIVNRSFRKIKSNFNYAYKCQKNNHAISESLGMILGAWCCEDNKTLKKGYTYLENCIKNQFSSDGGYMQQSFNYQRLALQDIDVVLAISKKTGVTISSQARELVIKSAYLLYQCQDDSGCMPNYGSNDGALILPLSTCGYLDYRHVINSTYALINQKRVYDNGLYDEEMIWFGIKGDLPRENIEKASSEFKSAGIYTLRSNNFWLMVASKNKINHMDQNHIDFWCDGKNILCDGGTYSYIGEVGKQLFSTSAHNTAYCRGKEQINRLGQFAVYGQPKFNSVKWNENSIHCITEFSSGYRHEREINMTDDGIEITDRVKNADALILFHTPEKVAGCWENELVIGNCTFSFDATPKIEDSVRSRFYLATENTKCVSVECNGKELNTKIKIKNI